MNNRELLALAAKAAGYQVWIEPRSLGCQFDNERELYLDMRGSKAWNPLTDDGDALRLAVKLHLSLTLNSFGAGAGGVDRNLRQVFKREKAGADGLPAATRLAIVLAAAEIGRFEP